MPHSDSETEENHGEVSSIWKRRSAHQPISRQPHVTQTHTHFANSSVAQSLSPKVRYILLKIPELFPFHLNDAYLNIF